MQELCIKKPKGPLLLVLVAIIGCALFTAWKYGEEYSLFDFGIYHRATQEFLAGNNPYSLPHQKTYLKSVPPASGAFESPTLMMWGPPPVFAVTWPFGLLALDAANKIFFGMTVGGTLLAFFLLWRMYLDNWRTRPLLEVVIISVLAFPSGWMVHGVYWGSLTWIALLGMVFCIALLRAQREFLAGLALYLVQIKLQLFMLPLAAIGALALKRRNFRFILGVSTAFLLGLLLVALISVESFTFFVNTPGLDLPYLLTSSTITSVVRAIFESSSRAFLFIPTAVLILAAGLYVLFSKQVPGNVQSAERLLVLLTPLAIAFGPYGWGHDYILALPLFLLAAREFLEARNSRRNGFAFVLVTLMLMTQLTLVSLSILTPRYPILFAIPALFIAALSIVVAMRLLFYAASRMASSQSTPPSQNRPT